MTQRNRDDLRSLSGPERAAILLLSLGEEHTVKLFSLMEDDEIKEISAAMAQLELTSKLTKWASQGASGGICDVESTPAMFLTKRFSMRAYTRSRLRENKTSNKKTAPIASIRELLRVMNCGAKAANSPTAISQRDSTNTKTAAR